MKPPLKSAVFVSSAKKDLRSFPKEVQDTVGRALMKVQLGLMPVEAKPLKGFSGASVLEIVEDYNTDTYRAVYTVQLADVVYVLHCFQKKSKNGISTPKQDIELIKQRLKQAQEHWRQYYDRR